ncbi:MAG: DUF1922 domain-containing protein [Candidatus Lokiarchaeota archaeon]|nr:DUF1922 domain-containing protein [Candidatus Lokiarchaeota archaeon]
MRKVFTQYKIFICPHCGLIQFVKDIQHSRRCPNSKCGKMINLEHVIVCARTYDIQKAVVIVQKLKEKKCEMQKMDEIRPLLEEEEDNIG